MDLLSGTTGFAVWFIIGVIALWFLYSIHRSNPNKKLITPSKCLLLAVALVSFICAFAFIPA